MNHEAIRRAYPNIVTILETDPPIFLDANESPVSVDMAQVAPHEAVVEAEREGVRAKAELKRIDLASIRSIREYIASKQDAPQILKDRETAAAAERAKIPTN